MEFLVVIVLSGIVYALLPKKANENLLEATHIDVTPAYDREEEEAQQLLQESAAEEELEIEQERTLAISLEDLAFRESTIEQTESELQSVKQELVEQSSQLSKDKIETDQIQQELRDLQDKVATDEQIVEQVQNALKYRELELDRESEALNQLREDLVVEETSVSQQKQIAQETQLEFDIKQQELTRRELEFTNFVEQSERELQSLREDLDSRVVRLSDDISVIGKTQNDLDAIQQRVLQTEQSSLDMQVDLERRETQVIQKNKIIWVFKKNF